MKKICVAFVSLLISGVTFSQDNAVEGTVKTLAFHTPYGSSRSVTVNLNGVSEPYCGTDTSNDFAFIREADGELSFQTIVSALLAAKMAKTPVEVLSHSADGGCVIHRVRMQ